MFSATLCDHTSLSKKNTLYHSAKVITLSGYTESMSIKLNFKSI